MLQAFLQVRLGEGFDEVMDDPAAQGLSDGFHLAGSADYQDIEVRCNITQLVHELQSVDVREMDVQQHEVGLEPLRFN
ncbi:hypothetical protein D3C73_1331600 [compost metagenome]